jgi:tryptophan 2,3-dioxygenase
MHRQKIIFLEEFERKYKDLFLLQMKEYNTINMAKIQLPENDQNNLELRTAMRHLDHTINITWVMQHLNVAIKYIDHSGLGNGQPAVVIGKIHAQKYQKRIFFQICGHRKKLQTGE